MSSDIKVNLSRSSVGSHLRTLMVNGTVIKLTGGGWQISEGFIATDALKVLTPMDIVEKAIRNMMAVK